MKHIGTQKLETDRLILRRFTDADDEAIFNNWAKVIWLIAASVILGIGHIGIHIGHIRKLRDTR